MHIIRLIIFIFIFIFIVISSSSGFSEFYTLAYGEQLVVGNDKNINFQWAFCSLTNTASGPEIKIINRDNILRTGDKIKFYIELEKECFVYLIYMTPQNEMKVLFPHQFYNPGSKHKLSKKYYIPKGNLWFELDEKTGFEKFYLLASVNQLTDLDNLLKRHQSSDSQARTKLTDDIISEIKKLKKKYKKFKSTAERPISIGGSIRGDDPIQDVASTAVKITADQFYSRTFTIEHR